MKKFLIWAGSILGVIAIILACYKYAWRLFGFSFCDQPNSIVVLNISVTPSEELLLRIGPSNSLNKFEGYTYKVKDNVLYVGIKTLPFMASGGLFPKDIHIETKEPFSRIVLTDGKAEEQIYPETE